MGDNQNSNTAGAGNAAGAEGNTAGSNSADQNQQNQQNQQQNQQQQQTFTNEQVTAIVQREVGKALKKKDAEITDLNKKIKGFEEADLDDMGKLQSRVKALEDDNGKKDVELKGANRKLAIYEALHAAGANSKDIPKLAKRVSGDTPEDIAKDIEELKTLGWLNQPGNSTPNNAQGAGNSGVNHQQQQGPTLDQQIEAAYNQAVKTGKNSDWERHTALMLKKQNVI